jgi:hypothetical protein
MFVARARDAVCPLAARYDLRELASGADESVENLAFRMHQMRRLVIHLLPARPEFKVWTPAP